MGHPVGFRVLGAASGRDYASGGLLQRRQLLGSRAPGLRAKNLHFGCKTHYDGWESQCNTPQHSEGSELHAAGAKDCFERRRGGLT